MTSTSTSLDPSVAHALSSRFADVFSTFDAGTDVFAPDAFFDLNMPVWRFQLQGPEAFAGHLSGLGGEPTVVAVLRTVATASGFVAEHEEYGGRGFRDLLARRMWLCDVDDERIVAATCFCTGEWDAELRARHAVEAPMLRPWSTPPA